MTTANINGEIDDVIVAARALAAAVRNRSGAVAEQMNATVAARETSAHDLLIAARAADRQFQDDIERQAEEARQLAGILYGETPPVDASAASLIAALGGTPRSARTAVPAHVAPTPAPAPVPTPAPAPVPTPAPAPAPGFVRRPRGMLEWALAVIGFVIFGFVGYLLARWMVFDLLPGDPSWWRQLLAFTGGFLFAMAGFFGGGRLGHHWNHPAPPAA